MTHDTAATNPNPPIGDVQPVPVHVVADSTRDGQASPARQRELRTKFETFVLTANDPTMCILPDSDDRYVAWVLAIDNDIVLGPTKGVVGATVNTVTNVPNPNGGYLSKGLLLRIDGTNPVYAGVTTTASNSRVSVFETYYAAE